MRKNKFFVLIFGLAFIHLALNNRVVANSIPEPTQSVHDALGENNQRVNAIRWSLNGDILAVVYDPGGLCFYDGLLFNETQIPQKMREQSPITTVEFGMDGISFMTGHEDGTIKFWNIQSGDNTASIMAHNGRVDTIKISPNGHLLISRGNDSYMRFWDVENLSLLHETAIHSFSRPVFNLDGKLVAFSGSKELDESGQNLFVAEVWDTQSLSLIRQFKVPMSDWLLTAFGDMAFSPDGNYLAAANSSLVVPIWDIQTGELINLIGSGVEESYAIAFSPEGSLLAIGGTGLRLKRLDINANQIVALETVMAFPRSATHDIAFNPIGDVLAFSDHNSVRLWNIQSDKEIAHLSVCSSAEAL